MHDSVWGGVVTCCSLASSSVSWIKVPQVVKLSKQQSDRIASVFSKFAPGKVGDMLTFHRAIRSVSHFCLCGDGRVCGETVIS